MYFDPKSFSNDGIRPVTSYADLLSVTIRPVAPPKKPGLAKRVVNFAVGLATGKMALALAALYCSYSVAGLIHRDHVEATRGARSGWHVPTTCSVKGLDGKTRSWVFDEQTSEADRRPDRKYETSPSAPFIACKAWAQAHGFQTVYAHIGGSVEGIKGMFGEPDMEIAGIANTYKADNTTPESLQEILDGFANDALIIEQQIKGRPYTPRRLHYEWVAHVKPELASLFVIRTSTPEERAQQKTAGETLDMIVDDVTSGRLFTIHRGGPPRP